MGYIIVELFSFMFVRNSYRVCKNIVLMLLVHGVLQKIVSMFQPKSNHQHGLGFLGTPCSIWAMYVRLTMLKLNLLYLRLFRIRTSHIILKLLNLLLLGQIIQLPLLTVVLLMMLLMVTTMRKPSKLERLPDKTQLGPLRNRWWSRPLWVMLNVWTPALMASMTRAGVPDPPDPPDRDSMKTMMS